MTKWEYARCDLDGRVSGLLGTGSEWTLTVLFYDPKKKNLEYPSKQQWEVVKWMGEQGWELVSVTDQYREDEHSNWWRNISLYFKKPVE